MTERVLYWDCVGGAAGDMLMASLIDAGADVEAVRRAHRALGLNHVTMEVHPVRSAGLSALQVDVRIDGQLADVGREGLPMSGRDAHRPYRSIRARLDEADLSPAIRDVAQAAFRLLAEAEARAHGIDVEEVHFHEVGSDDAIADIVGVAVCLASLGIDRVLASPVPLGRGMVRAAHGPIPVPAPATLHILRGVPVDETDLQGETVTPTGAALLKATASSFGPIPSLVLSEVGMGAGHKEWPDRPNVVRALIGELREERGRRADECIVEANLDDLWPAHLPLLLEALFDAGAIDAWAETLLMKKGRPGHRVCALVRRSGAEAVTEAFFRYGSTLGVRRYDVERTLLERRLEPVSTEYGEVRVKVSVRPGGVRLAVPEFEDCRRVAAEAGTTVRDVFDAALAAARQRSSGEVP